MKAKALIEAAFQLESPEDLAAEFIEEEIGQYDWFENLQTIRGELQDDGLKYAIELWLEETGRNGDAIAIIQELNRLAEESPTAQWQQLIKPRTPLPSKETFRNPRVPPQVPPGAPQLKIPPQPLGGAVSLKV